MSVGTRLREVRRALGYSQADVERLSGRRVRKDYVAQVETGKVAVPGVRALLVLGQVYGLDRDSLLRIVEDGTAD